jgi:hypothetical protein
MESIRFFTRLLSGPAMQVPTGTNQFFEWFFYGLSGLGGWLILLLLALAATVWLLYDSNKRRLPATGWRLGIVLLSLLLLPTVLYRFTVTPVHFGIYQILNLYAPDCPIDIITQSFPEVTIFDCGQLMRSLPPLTPFGEYVFYLGLLGGILAPVLAVGYFLTFQGMVGDVHGHVYEAVLGQCPECEAERQRNLAQQPQPVYSPSPPPTPGVRSAALEPRERAPVRSHRKAVQYAWLMDLTHNHRYDLFEDITSIGRAGDNDIYLPDQAVSRKHAQIREFSGHFTLSDIGSSTGTLLNGKKIRAPQVLQNGDEVVLGDTVLKFVTSR